MSNEHVHPTILASLQGFAPPPNTVVYRKGTSLFEIVRDGVSRDLGTAQIIAEAAASSYTIDHRLVDAIRRDFHAQMTADAIQADLRYNRDKNSGKLEREKVARLQQEEVNLQSKTNPQLKGEYNGR